MGPFYRTVSASMNKPNLHKAANGHLTIDFEEYNSPKWSKAISILEIELGYDRKGETIAGLDEGIMPPFVKGSISITAGWDNWSGNYLLSESKETVEILQSLYRKIMALA